MWKAGEDRLGKLGCGGYDIAEVQLRQRHRSARKPNDFLWIFEVQHAASLERQMSDMDIIIDKTNSMTLPNPYSPEIFILCFFYSEDSI